jgi:hypothetical protein
LGHVRGDLIEKGCKPIAKAGKDAQIHLALADPKQIVPAAIAVARAFPKFTLKSKDQASTDTPKVQVKQKYTAERDVKSRKRLNQIVNDHRTSRS